VTQVQQILNYLWSVAPNGATNAQIAQGTGITSHQGVYMTTQHLLSDGRLRAERAGRSWVFFSVEGPAVDWDTRQARPRAEPAIRVRR
jgi:hypothetical protein